MSQRTVIIGSKVGLHARPAKLFTSAAAATGVKVQIAKAGGTPVDASSILRVMTLGAKFGEEVTLTAEGEGAEEALDQLASMLATDLDAGQE